MAQRFPSHIFNAHPLTKRLGSVQEALKRIAEASSKGERNQGFHDAAFWAGRTIADVLNHNKNPEGEGIYTTRPLMQFSLRTKQAPKSISEISQPLLLTLIQLLRGRSRGPPFNCLSQSIQRSEISCIGGGRTRCFLLGTVPLAFN